MFIKVGKTLTGYTEHKNRSEEGMLKLQQSMLLASNITTSFLAAWDKERRKEKWKTMNAEQHLVYSLAKIVKFSTIEDGLICFSK